ncbi:NUDIX domain-containing protein [Anaerophaga thermohalophila]|uniref:NUDIX domain-containing protein n=1 Tax=Anaerophaga thermohalophila TaxID=177400 RepID=UPI0004753762|nr:NUDIX domain-containing protein [Anaerophaga thermohalophila]
MTSRICFNIRVYGICIENDQLLVTDEYVMDTFMTKFPGGGLEYGEGTVECLERECREELGLEIRVTGHYYTTDFFQPARFYENTQLISIYYTFELPEKHKLPATNKKFDFKDTPKNGEQSFRWIPLAKLTSGEMTFPIDKVVVKKILETAGISG